MLVVIGILIALQVNNWNENRKNNKLRESYKQNLIVDLNKDLENLSEHNRINTAAETEGQYLLELLNDELVDVDTLRLTNALIICGYIPNSTIVYSTYNDLINSNKIQLFNDLEFKRLLDDYYINDDWSMLFKSRILKTAWYDYRDELVKFHSPELYEDFYANKNSIANTDFIKYDVKWDQIKNNTYLKKQIGLIVAYRIIIRNELEERIDKAKAIFTYMDKYTP